MSRRLLYHCQHLVGVGHLSRSLAIARAFLQAGWQVDFVQGGPDIGRRLEHPQARWIQLPAFLMEPSKKLIDPLGRRSVDEIWQERGQILDELTRQNTYDTVITELFPFGRSHFQAEYFTLLSAVRAKNPRALRVSSVRDVLIEKKEQAARDIQTARLIQDHFDLVLVHTDPRLIQLAETFSQTAALEGYLRNTGFVTETGGRSISSSRRQPQVLVSFGGGSTGESLGRGVLQAAPLIPELQFRFLCGPYTSPELRQEIQRAAQALPNVKAEEFLNDFESQLSTSCLSISMGGYNTVMNLLSTRTPALVLPFDGDQEQGRRAQRLQDHGLLRCLLREELQDPAHLAELIRQAAQVPIPEFPLDLEGARRSVELVEEALR